MLTRDELTWNLRDQHSKRHYHHQTLSVQRHAAWPIRQHHVHGAQRSNVAAPIRHEVHETHDSPDIDRRLQVWQGCDLDRLTAAVCVLAVVETVAALNNHLKVSIRLVQMKRIRPVHT